MLPGGRKTRGLMTVLLLCPCGTWLSTAQPPKRCQIKSCSEGGRERAEQPGLFPGQNPAMDPGQGQEHLPQYPEGLVLEGVGYKRLRTLAGSQPYGSSLPFPGENTCKTIK